MMIKVFKKISYKISATTVAISLMTGFVPLANGLNTNIYASTKTAASATVKSLSAEDTNSAPKSTRFTNLKDLSQYKNLIFKLPDFIPEGYFFQSITVFEFPSGDKNAIVTYISKDDKDLSINISPQNPVDTAKDRNDKNFSTSVKKAPMKVGNVEGTSITQNNKGTIAKQSYEGTNKAFTWNIDNIWYSINYYVTTVMKGKSSTLCDISSDDLEKMVESFKSLKDLDQSKYEFKPIASNNVTSIDSQKDLEAAEKNYGYTHMLPTSIAGYSFSNGYSAKGISPHLMATYLAPDDISKKVDKPSSFFEVTEWNDPNMFDQQIDLGYVLVGNGDQSKDIKAKLNKFNIDGIDVYGYDTPILVPTEIHHNYFFVQNGITISVLMIRTDKDQEILSELIKALK